MGRKGSSKNDQVLGSNTDQAGANDLKPNIIVGIGASAGGLSSLEKFFGNLPSDTGMAFVIVMHLDPDRKTILPEILVRHTQMPVVFAENSIPVAANCVYVIPANYDLTVVDHQFCLQEMAKTRGAKHTIDIFFRSLAKDMGDRSIGIVLSGSGSDGTEGVKAINVAGGIVFAESEKSASYSSMPKSAVATGQVDLVLAAEEMPGRLISIVPAVEGQLDVLAEHSTLSEQDLVNIYRIVQQKTGNDLKSYKENTVTRRIYRRMVVHHMKNIQDYLALLKQHSEECYALAREVLISVTSFFRDPDAFAELECRVLPQLFKKQSSEDSIRIWLTGCATGEEAYSVAILLCEYMKTHELSSKVKIFATDLDASAIDYARKGLYPTGIQEHLSKQRLSEYFIQKAGHYEVKPYLREMIVFAQHNLVKDPPFSKLDLVVCRNLLIYLTNAVQKRIMPLFHQVLNPEGFLFIGPSETIGQCSELFSPLSVKWKIYQRKEVHKTQPVDFPSASFSYSKTGPFDGLPGTPKAASPGSVLEKVLVERYAPPSMLINEKNEVLYYSTRTNRYLEIPVGEPTQNLLKLAKEELRPSLRAALHKAHKEKSKVSYDNVTVKIDGVVEELSIHVDPLHLPVTLRGLTLVVLEPLPRLVNAACTEPVRVSSDLMDKDQIISQLDEQLRITHDELQDTISRLETSNEELKSSNEELMSINEEFQSTNEELETSKEELQALNEELITVNGELEAKVEELNRANDDINNLLNSSEIATLFLDRELLVKFYTPASMRLYNLIPADIGRPFAHISGKISGPQFIEDAKKVLQSLQPLEREVVTEEQLYYLVRIFPYRTEQDVIDGVVLTFTDITSRYNAEQVRAKLTAFIGTTSDAIIGMTFDGTVTSWNHGAEELYGYTAVEMIGNSIDRIIPAEQREDTRITFEKLRQGQRIARDETTRIGKEGNVVEVSISFTPVFNNKGVPVACASIAHDITREKQQQLQLIESEEQQRLRAEELAALMDAVPAAVFMTRDAKAAHIEANNAGQQLLNLTRRDCITDDVFEGNDIKTFKVFSGSKELKRSELPLERVAATGKAISNFEEDLVFADGTRTSLLGNIVPFKNSADEPCGALAVFMDITDRVTMERELAKSKEIMRLFIEHAPVALAMFDTNMNYLAVSERWRYDYGLHDVELTGLSHYEVFPDIPKRWREIHQRSLHGELLSSDGDCFERRDGTVQWLRWEIHPWYLDGKNIGGIILFTEDISALKISQDAVLRNEKELSALFNQAAIGIAKVGTDGSWLRVNERLCEIVGYSREELEQLTFQDITYAEDLDSDLDYVGRMVAGEIESYSMEKRYVCKDKSLVWINLTVSAGRNSDNQIDFFISIIEDIDQRKIAEQRHAELEQELRQKYKMEAIGIMSGGIAHNFNNSLSVILGNVEIAKLRLSGQKEVADYLDKAKLAIMRTRSLIDQVMLYSHKKNNVKTALNLNQIIDESLIFLRSILPSSIMLHYQSLTDREDFIINASASSIQEILLNLANNASYAMDEKGELNIALKSVTLDETDIPVLFKDTCCPGVFACISFEDSGSGIPATIIDQIFDPFFTTKGLSEGTGIGLSTVMGIMKNSGGMVEVSSVPGKGALFELYFPLITHKPISEPFTLEPVSHGDEHILYVDDDENVLNVNQMILSSLGYQVTAEVSGPEALKILEEGADNFDLLITDQTMPELTGIELYQKLKEKGIKLPTILCTGFSNKVTETTATELGIDAFCFKPLDIGEIAKVIRLVLDNNKSVS